MDLKTAREIAEGLVATLAPACERIQIAGSIRRGAPEVKDIEIVCIPKPAPRPEFGKPVPREPLRDVLQALMEGDGVLKLKPAGKDGARMKTFIVPAREGRGAIQLDLFIVRPPATWGVILAIRTGPADFSHWLVTKVTSGGACPVHLRVQDGALWHAATGEQIPTDTEEQFFAALGERWVEPGRRVARWGRRRQPVR